MSNLYFIPVEGTGSPDAYGWGFPQDMAFALEDPWADILAQFVGSDVANVYTVLRSAYPAATFPMGPSVQAGRKIVGNMIRALPHGSKVVLFGYSQGAMVVDYVVLDFIAGAFPNAELLRAYNVGDPMRCPGIYRGNELAGQPAPSLLDGVVTGGIAGKGNLTAAQSTLIYSGNNDGDLYGAAPCGADPWNNITGVGADEELMFDLIQDFNGQNVTALLTKGMTLLGLAPTAFTLPEMVNIITAVIAGAIGPTAIPLPLTGVSTPDELVSLVMALMNGGMFVLTGMGPHGDYGKYVPAFVDDAIRIGKAA